MIRALMTSCAASSVAPITLKLLPIMRRAGIGRAAGAGRGGADHRCPICRGGRPASGVAADQLRKDEGFATREVAGGVVRSPFSNGRPRTRPGGFGVNPSVIDISLVQPAGHFRNRPFGREYIM